MRWVLAPDSFKGSLSAQSVAQAMACGIRRADETAHCDLLPMADGGEGTLDALAAAVGGTWLHVPVHHAEGELKPSVALLLPDGTVVVEVARIVGLPDVTDSPVLTRTSSGVGEMLAALLQAGHRRFAVALGGSCTNDGGVGCLAALGVHLRDAAGQPVTALPARLAEICQVDITALDSRLAEAELEIWSDVSNPLTGPNGATAVFGPQKGVPPEQVATLDAAIARFAELADTAFGQPCRQRAGSGAAGGLGYALQLLGGRPCPGAQAVARHIGLAEALQMADWVLTGEGRSDGQTLAGKAPLQVAAMARQAGVPVSLLSGAVVPDGDGQLVRAFDGCFSLCNRPMTLSQAMDEAEARIAQQAEQLARLVLASRGRTR
ncbi:MAG TPA: glycerate kinase [Chromobacteriaceae bacterium]|nr:glycerate kinase [Chromobacteriaceae bacterium]